MMAPIREILPEPPVSPPDWPEYPEYEDEEENVSEPSDDEPFTIDSDEKAEWALKKIKEAQEERDRLLALVAKAKEELTSKQQSIENRYARDTEYLMMLLAQYMGSVKSRETKTQRTYQLLSGKLVQKKPSVTYNVDDAALAGWLQERGYQDLCTVKPKWGEVKKVLAGDPATGAVLMDGTGELVEGVTAVETPGEFRVQF